MEITEIRVEEYTKDTKFPYSVKPKLTLEEIINVKIIVAKQKALIHEWVADAIRRKLKEEQSGN